MGVQGFLCSPAPCPYERWKYPGGGSSHPPVLGAQSGKWFCCPVLICPDSCQLSCWRALSCGSEFSEQLTQEANRGLKSGLLRVMIPETHLLSEVKANTCFFLPLLLLSPKSLALEVLQRPVPSPTTAKMFFFLCVFPSALQASVNGFTVAFRCRMVGVGRPFAALKCLKWSLM